MYDDRDILVSLCLDERKKVPGDGAEAACDGDNHAEEKKDTGKEGVKGGCREELLPSDQDPVARGRPPPRPEAKPNVPELAGPCTQRSKVGYLSVKPMEIESQSSDRV